MKKILLVFCIAFSISFNSFSDEGMWLPMLVERLNYVDMQEKGLKLTPDELYSINHSSLKDAIIGLGFTKSPMQFFCSAELVSGEGLVLTNHHCGFEAIQSHSSLSANYVETGFWALNREQELPNEGLSASFLVRMEDVTKLVLSQLTDSTTDDQRDVIVDSITKELSKKNSENGLYQISVKSFFKGNEYYMFVYKTYMDVRLVGAPPASIGKFGGDTDNWMWPRHTGDFSVLRIYTAPDGKPAAYNKNNVPLKSTYFLPISIQGIAKDDFAMIWGYPGTTQRFMSSYGINVKINEENPATIKIRGARLSIMKEDMNADNSIKIKYVSKYAEISNYWKFYIGENKGVKRLQVYEHRKDQEQAFQNWVDSDSIRIQKYGGILKDMESANATLMKFKKTTNYYEEALFAPEVIALAYQALSLQQTWSANPKMPMDSLKPLFDELRNSAKEIFKNYNKATDKRIMATLYKMFKDDVSSDLYPSFYNDINKKFKGDVDAYVNELYEKSMFVDSLKLNEFLKKPTLKKLNNDPAYNTMMSVLMIYGQVYYVFVNILQKQLDDAERLYIAGIREMNANKKYYPDANSTMRMTYGQVKDYIPGDAMHYNWYTTLSGVIEKEDSANEEFVVPAKLKELYKKKDFGPYGKDDVNVCFLTTTDITGGNSGSPVLNAKGELIGIAFDGNWEAMSGNIAFENNVQRTINVDIRYVLFVIDKYAGADYLLKEMNIVQ